MTYPELQAAAAADYREANRSIFTLGMPSWGALGRAARAGGVSPSDLFAAIHKAAIDAAAAQVDADWSQAYAAAEHPVAALDGPTLIATIISAVLGVVCPALGVAAPLIEPILAAVVKAILASLQSQLLSGARGSSPAECRSQLQQWAAEARAA